MTRIDPSTLGPLPFLGGTRAPVGPRLLDPSPLVRRADRADIIDIRSVQPAPTPPAPVERLVAAAVPASALPGATGQPAPAQISHATHRALRFYSSPGDQNAAATLGAAGRRLDVTV